MRHPLLLLFLLPLIPACGDAWRHTEPDGGVRAEPSDGGVSSPCDFDAARCESRANVGGAVHGVRPDGRVDVTVAEAWPHRPPQPTLLPREDLARACVMLAACLYMEDLSAAAWPSDVDSVRASWAATCAGPQGNGEEWGVPAGAMNERLAWLLPVALDARGDCSVIRAARTRRPPPLKCEAHGCEWRGDGEPMPSVTCDGTRAVLRTGTGTYVRDCARSFEECDEMSPTGCTDRPLVRCDPAGKDRCDGDVRLGCRMIGFVSYRDCTRLGGTCRELTKDTAECVYPGSCKMEQAECDHHSVRLCAAGEEVAVDCLSLGFSGCRAGRCF